MEEFNKQLKQEKLLFHQEIVVKLFERYDYIMFTRLLCRQFYITGMSLLIDTTIGGLEIINQFWTDQKIPSIRICITKFPLIYSIIEYIDIKYGNDFAIIFENKMGKKFVIVINIIEIYYK